MNEFIGPMLQCEVPGCNIEAVTAFPFERHEIAPGFWAWVCFGDALALELSEGK